ncbi:MAG: hypothetical protein L3J54_13980 [Draconibacterium sp.]|nr:hypothetical protein [Draconibacterium sp.]
MRKTKDILIFVFAFFVIFAIAYGAFLFFYVQKKYAESPKEKTELKNEPTEKVDLTKIPDSLELITDKKLSGDFNGDNKMDFASIVKNKNNQKTGVLIIHNSLNEESFVFGAGREIDQMTDLNWIDIFETLPKGKIVSPTLIDEETGDIKGQDESKNFKLIGNGIFMSVEESHGGGIIFWDGKEYKWYHIE